MDNLNVELDLYQLYQNVSLNLEDNICMYSKQYLNHIVHVVDDLSHRNLIKNNIYIISNVHILNKSFFMFVLVNIVKHLTICVMYFFNDILFV